MHVAVRLRALVFFIALTLLSGSVSAQDDIGEPRVGAYFALAVAGEVDLDVGSLSSSADLDPTVGFGTRFELPVHDYIAVGGFFELLTFEADTAFDEQREAVLNFDAWVKARYRFEVARDVELEPYLGFPFGLSLAVLDDPDGSGDEVWPGFNTGLLAGIIAFFGHFGAMFELGWRHHQVFTEARSLLGDVDLRVETNQLALHFGGFYRF